ncbi:MAG: amidase domain-containing protein [Epulopiscium sp. Nuni2H_MBin003]|nr:MAG: amidase domain-containing protein [Epulopiscium sp. Nuni2H_MBin003]
MILAQKAIFATDVIPFEIELETSEEEILEENTESPEPSTSSPKLSEEELMTKFFDILSGIILNRNEYVLNHDIESLEKLYDTDIKVSRYAFEHESIKADYLANWAQKQGITFSDIDSFIKMRKVRDRENGLFGMTCNINTTYTYHYNNEPEVSTSFSLGTSHYIHLQQKGEDYVIVKEWYTDPFSDSLELKGKEPQELTDFIVSQNAPDFTPSETLKKGLEYAHTYCGIGAGEHMFKYNSKSYMDCNPLGGDCANFASQIMFESGAFKKNGTWNYDGDGTATWVNAQKLTYYLMNSGRGGRIAHGSYEKVYKSAFNLRPGDIVAYEKKGRITHVSTVTALDNKGYPLVTCHNTDRLVVPYDLGWSNSNITFHLIDVYY